MNQDVDSDPNGDTAGERAVTPGSPLDNNVTDITKAGDQDDHDPAGPNVFDLAQRKTVVTAGPFTYGQEVDFKITVFNQGNVTAQNVLITDYIPSGFAYVSAYGWTFDGVNKATQTITSTIKPGDSSSLLIKLRVLPNPSSSTAYVNVAEISGATDTTNTPRVDIDSNPDGNPGNDGDPVDDEINDPNDEDDHDPSRIDVYDLALRKVVTTPPTYTYGQNLNFRIRVYNQGTLPVTNTVVEDYIPVGYTYLSSLNPLWTGAAPTVSYTHVPVLNPGDSFEINLILQLSRTDGGATDWINYSEISSMRDVTGTTDVSAQDVDSDPNGDTAGEREVTPGSTNDDNITDITKAGDQDDHDPAGIEIYDLALRKQFKGTYPLRYGDIIAYEIKIFNQGNVNAQNIFVSDYIPQGYSFNPIENPNWVYDPITRIASTTFSNVVVAGDSAAVSINLTLEQFTGDRSAWKNIAEIETSEDTNGNPKEDIDSTPDKVVDNDGNPVDDAIHDPNDEDDHDPAEVEVLDIALRKWVPNEKPYYVPGEEVDFVISLHNQGNVVSSSIVVKDYLPNGFTFVAASNPGWTLVGSNLEYDYNTRLYPTDSIQLHLKLIVIIPASNVTLSSWENYAEIFSVRDTSGVLRSTDDADSFAGSDTPYERSVHDNDPYDEVIDGTGIVLLPNEDEDDHDPEAVVVTAYLGDKVWKDLDGDGVQDAGEMPLQGVLVTIYDCATGAVVQRDTTDINGNYGFEGLFGDKDYFVRFDASPLGMPNCAWTFKDRGGNDRTDSDVNASGVTDCTHLDWGERDSTVDAGFVELAAYGDYVWHDRDVDGQQEFGEEGIGGVTVTLYDAATNQIVRTGITDNNGYYFFDKLMPMQYYAKYTRPAGYGDTDFNIGSDVTDNDVDGSNGAGTNATTYLSPGETDRTWDYGVYKCSCISGEVWYDLNKDGIYQGIENGINGLSVYLVNAMTGAVVASTITGPKPGTPSDDGYYSFCSCLRPGMYYIRYDRPGDLAASAAFQGTDRTKDSHLTHAYGPNTSEKITVVSGSDIKDIHAGFQVKAVVGNYVWLDGNQNGLQDSGEKPVQGVKVAAYNTAGVMVSESTTGVDGKYLLDGIAAGDYYVKFVPSSQYGFTSANRGNDDIDSDVTGTQGLGTTQVMRLNTGDAIPHVDAGLILSVLPLEWLDFTAEYNGSFTELNWSTGAEINNSHFEIERRHESEKDFAKIGQESASTDASAALHEYSHDDYDVVKSGLYYYRIKQVDRDGKYSYSKIIAIKKLKANDLSIYIYPNPVRDLLKVEIDLSTDEDVIVDVIDANGKVVMHQPFGGRMKAGRSNELLNTEMLTSGNYVIRIKTSQTVVSKKFTVAK
ncbi:MAG: DUF11 domain-containing protein [Saprospiraceae bacterium]|nr:DUF11 domain-containing protein [Saprospiraceae bacterium]